MTAAAATQLATERARIEAAAAAAIEKARQDSADDVVHGKTVMPKRTAPLKAKVVTPTLPQRERWLIAGDNCQMETGSVI
ncbi:MAG: hypothetical protein GEU95_25350 [Rhizobiales bacterium]|nr:hypothetical protein [Hyphomicrobiales bacterium]